MWLFWFVCGVIIVTLLAGLAGMVVGGIIFALFADLMETDINKED